MARTKRVKDKVHAATDYDMGELLLLTQVLSDNLSEVASIIRRMEMIRDQLWTLRQRINDRAKR